MKTIIRNTLLAVAILGTILTALMLDSSNITVHQCFIMLCVCLASGTIAIVIGGDEE